MSLLWWVFLTNGAVLAVALLLLAFSPIEVDAPIKSGQFALLLAGFVVLIGVNLRAPAACSLTAAPPHGGR